MGVQKSQTTLVSIETSHFFFSAGSSQREKDVPTIGDALSLHLVPEIRTPNLTKFSGTSQKHLQNMNSSLRHGPRILQLVETKRSISILPGIIPI